MKTLLSLLFVLACGVAMAQTVIPDLPVASTLDSGKLVRLIPAITQEETLVAATISSTETVFGTNGDMSYTVPANSVHVGDKFIMHWRGRRATTSVTPTLTFRFRWGGVGGTQLIATSALGASAMTDAYIEGNAFITITQLGASGKALVGGCQRQVIGTTSPTWQPMGNGTSGGQNATVTIDTTTASSIVFTLQYSANTAGNTIGISEYDLYKIAA